jgi:hypothetical protein
MNTMKLLLIALLSMLMACSQVHDNGNNEEMTKAEIRRMVSNYIKTAEYMDAKSMVEYFYESEDFHCYVDGKRYNYTEMKNLVLNDWNEQFKSLNKLEFKYDSIYVYMYQPGQAISFFQAKEILVDTSDNKFSIQTNVTFGCVYDGGKWKIAYEHGSTSDLE